MGFKVGDRVVALCRMETFFDDYDKPKELNAEPGDIGTVLAVDPHNRGDTDIINVSFPRSVTICSVLEVDYAQ